MVLVRNGKIHLREVEVRDRLRFAQIRVLPRLRGILLSLEVLQVERGEGGSDVCALVGGLSGLGRLLSNS